MFGLFKNRTKCFWKKNQLQRLPTIPKSMSLQKWLNTCMHERKEYVVFCCCLYFVSFNFSFSCSHCWSCHWQAQWMKFLIGISSTFATSLCFGKRILTWGMNLIRFSCTSISSRADSNRICILYELEMKPIIFTWLRNTLTIDLVLIYERYFLDYTIVNWERDETKPIAKTQIERQS